MVIIDSRIDSDSFSALSFRVRLRVAFFARRGFDLIWLEIHIEWLWQCILLWILDISSRKTMEGYQSCSLTNLKFDIYLSRRRCNIRRSRYPWESPSLKVSTKPPSTSVKFNKDSSSDGLHQAMFVYSYSMSIPSFERYSSIFLSYILIHPMISYRGVCHPRIG